MKQEAYGAIIIPFSRYGGKYKMLKEIYGLIPEHKIFMEPFMGSGVVTINLPFDSKKIMGDADELVAHFMKTLKDEEKGKQLEEELMKLKYGPGIFQEALEDLRNNFRGMSEVEKAGSIFVLFTQSYNSTGKSFARGRYKSDKAYRKHIHKSIPRVREKLQNIEVFHLDARTMIEKVKHNRDVFVYNDPPYRQALRGDKAGNVYRYEMPDDAQVEYLKLIRDAECRMMLSGYRAEEGEDFYDRYLKGYGWHCYKLKDVPKSCQSGKRKKDIGHEYVWVNYELPEGASAVIDTTDVMQH